MTRQRVIKTNQLPEQVTLHIQFKGIYLHTGIFILHFHRLPLQPLVETSLI